MITFMRSFNLVIANGRRARKDRLPYEPMCSHKKTEADGVATKIE